MIPESFDYQRAGSVREALTLLKQHGENAKVTAKLVSNGKHEKIRVFKMKRRKDYRRTYGHRQNFSEIQIESITS